MDVKIKVYCDSGAMDKRILKKIYSKCEFYHFPYDSKDRPKDFNIILAMPSASQWRDVNHSCGENKFTWADSSESEIFTQIIDIVGKSHRRDALHLDSAYKQGCHIFLTSDKGHIYSNKARLEDLCKIKIFYIPEELEELEKYVETRKTLEFLCEEGELGTHPSN